MAYSTKPPVKLSSSGYSYGRIHIWCIRVLGDSVIVNISCISESVIVVWNSTCSAPCWLTFMLFGPKQSQEALRSYPVFHLLRTWRIGPFRVPPGLCIKTSAQPLIWKWFFILMQIKLILIRKVLHLASFWKWGFLELGSGLFGYLRRHERSFLFSLFSFLLLLSLLVMFFTINATFYFFV